MTDDQLELRLREWYQAEIPGDELAPPDLRSRLAVIPRVSSHPGRRFASRRGFTLLAAAALVGILAGTAAVGGRILTPPPESSMAPSQFQSGEPTDLPSTQPSIAPAMGRIVSTRWRTLTLGEDDCTSRFGCYRASVVISNDDGSDERELFPEPSSRVLAASRDGSKVIVSTTEPDGDHTYLTDVDRSALRPLETHCQSPCLDDFEFTLSADGSRLAFVRSRSGEPGSDENQVVATMDMVSGAVVELESSKPFWGRPGLSPDGTRVAFGNHVVDVDGSNLQEIAPADLFTAFEQLGVFTAGLAAPQWSMDGSLIAFTSFNDTFPTNPPERNSQRRMDIWVVRPDGTDLKRLTTDTVGPLGTNAPGDFGASFPTWTRDGRIVFSRYPARDGDPLELWVMDADGSNATRLDPSNAAALTALGCVACPYRPGGRLAGVVPSYGFWIPAR